MTTKLSLEMCQERETLANEDFQLDSLRTFELEFYKVSLGRS